MAPKPNGKWRLVTDYCHVHSKVDDDPFSLPVIEDVMKDQGGNALWPVFDLEDGIHQVHLAPKSKYTAFVTPWDTAFVTPWRVYECVVLPMGLKTSPTRYLCMIVGCLGGGGFTTKHATKPYIDNIVPGSQDRERDRQPGTEYKGLFTDGGGAT